jgi:hypothetical protein
VPGRVELTAISYPSIAKMNHKTSSFKIRQTPEKLTKPASVFYITARNIYKTSKAIYHNVGNEKLKLTSFASFTLSPVEGFPQKFTNFPFYKTSTFSIHRVIGNKHLLVNVLFF